MDAKTNRKNLWFFPLGTVGRDMVYQLFNNFILLYTLYTRKLSAAQLMAITGIMIAARVFDALNDPLMGNIIDRTRTRWGKFKPWLVIGILSTSVVIYLAFNTTLQGWSFVWFFGIIYFMYSITYTMHDISYWGMIPSLGTNADDRNKFTSRATLFAGIGGTLAGLLIPMLTAGQLTWGGSSIVAYGRIALVIAILSPLFLCITVFGVHENRDYEKEPAPPVNFKKIVNTIKNNDQLVWISGIFLLQQIGNGIVTGGIGSTYIYFEFGYEGGLYSTFSTIGMMATAVLMVTYPMVSRKLHRKQLMTISAVIGTIGYVIMIIVGMLLPSNMLKFWVLTLGFMLANFGQYCMYLIMMISILNTVEYNELKTGMRDDAIIASIRPFVTKLGSALIVGIVNISYVVFGVLEYTSKISAFEQQTNQGLITEAEKVSGISAALSGVQNMQSVGLLFSMTIIPCLFMLATYFLYRKHYKLDEEEYAGICEELAQRKAEKA